MNLGFFRLEKEGYSLVGGILFVLLLGAWLRPHQSDNAHTIGLLSAKGGSVVHAGHLYLQESFRDSYSLLLTATVLPPVSGDIRVELTGPEKLDYQITSRNPPGLPITNHFHPWYRFEENVLRGVQPLDKLVVYVRMKAPSRPGDYTLVLSDASNSARIFLNMPLSFSYREASGLTSEDPLENWPCH